MKLTAGQFYWLSNPEHGTQRAKLEIVPANQRSLFFLLEAPILLQSDPAGGGAIAHGLPLFLNAAKQYVDLVTRAQVWTITTERPAAARPTK